MPDLLTLYIVCTICVHLDNENLLEPFFSLNVAFFSQDDDKRHAKLLDAISGLGGKKVSVTINSTSYIDMCQ